MSIPWVELYRPKEFSDIQHQEQAVSAFKQCVSTGQLPNLLLFGPQGTGKTTCIQALAHQLFGPDYYKDRVHEINASSDRGVQVIRDRVKPLAQRKISAVAPRAGYNYPVPALQIIILEEADALTRDAQAALRRIIEDCSQTTRLALLCNYPSQIIGPIVSRCAKFRFVPLPPPAIQLRLQQICAKESIIFEDALLEKLAVQSNGDMRKAVTQLQMVCQISDLKQGQKQIQLKDLDNLNLVQGITTQNEINTILRNITATNDKEFLSFIEETASFNFDVEELVNSIFVKLISLDQSDKIRIAAAQEYQKFGMNIARRCGEKLALQKFMLGLRVAALLK
ncbi:Replication_factor C [Hexamita inflata]|uniref:Subunit 4 n=1 Tax=Hexamita inflata TaxID=28002 RepID=A0AA86Q224_9EUKA|nr:Replication factor C [Hexamita inflata]